MLELDDGRLYLSGEDADERYPVIWPAGTAAQREAVVLASGDEVAVGESAHGGGGYYYVDDIESIAEPEPGRAMCRQHLRRNRRRQQLRHSNRVGMNRSRAATQPVPGVLAHVGKRIGADQGDNDRVRRRRYVLAMSPCPSRRGNIARVVSLPAASRQWPRRGVRGKRESVKSRLPRVDPIVSTSNRGS